MFVLQYQVFKACLIPLEILFKREKSTHYQHFFLYFFPLDMIQSQTNHDEERKHVWKQVTWKLSLCDVNPRSSTYLTHNGVKSVLKRLSNFHVPLHYWFNKLSAKKFYNVSQSYTYVSSTINRNLRELVWKKNMVFLSILEPVYYTVWQKSRHGRQDCHDRGLAWISQTRLRRWRCCLPKIYSGGPMIIYCFVQ